ncbi:GNAT family N-acetyltransferase [Bacillus dakarensis]|uniref:GNAT family N-acetyltransferase n=1 Tax=Robertmurraya dakarensis TaxID=1926278 RepID=UPI000980F778|nr:GNAT family N-acetyltransferase [Bacillus dakarensis]
MGWDDAFEDFPVLETERFYLRKIELTDAKSIFNYFSKNEVTKFYDLETFSSEQEAIELIHSLLYRYKAKKQIRWGIQPKDRLGIIGSCGFHALELEHFKAEIGYELHPDYWNKGIMTEVIQRVVEYGFTNLELNRVEAFYEPLNHGSQKVLEKNGFKIEGILKKRFLEKGKFVDAAIAAVLREEFFNQF